MKFASLCLTNKCNLKCKMCDIGQRNREASGMGSNWDTDKELSPKQWARILDRLEVGRIHLQGVEPLLYNGFDELVKLIKRKDRIVLVTTNGWFIEKHFAALCMYCDNIAVSLDGLEEMHDRIRGVKGSFRRAYNGLKKLKEAGKHCRISFAITPENVEDMMAVQDLGIELVFNHYNSIHPSVCKKYDCVPSNLDIYDPADMDIDELYEAIDYCIYATFLPNLKTKAELHRYYKEIPKERQIKEAGCSVANLVAKGDRFCIAANGDFLISDRCWIKCNLGNALNGNTLPQDSPELQIITEEIKDNGIPEPCQRLCCGGKQV